MVFDGADDVRELSAGVENDGDVKHRIVDWTVLVIGMMRRRDTYRQAY